MQLIKSAIYTDIHFGAKSNSDQHNEDCIDYLHWFASQVTKMGDVDNIVFLGDYFENRSSINIATLRYAYEGAKIINNLGLPVFFVTGNHDLYHRHTREIHSLSVFNEFKNFKVIDSPSIIKKLGDGTLICPYMFHHEYPDLKKFLSVPTWMGHFEFKDFIVTGYNVRMPTGPDACDFRGPEFILSGHFHKRQADENVVYVGNTFPTNFADEGDNERGMAIFDHVSREIDFIDWEECPKYVHTTLSHLIDGVMLLPGKARVKCLADVVVSYEEMTSLRQMFIERYKLRELVMEETNEVTNALAGTQLSTKDYDKVELANIDDLMIKMLQDIKVDKIDNQLLVQLYKNTEAKQ